MDSTEFDQFDERKENKNPSGALTKECATKINHCSGRVTNDSAGIKAKTVG